MKKILILTVTAGNGHNACAAVMKHKLESIGGCEVKTVDLLKEYSSKINVWTADGGYCLAVSKLPKLYNAFYNHYMKLPPEKRYSCPSQNTVVSTLDGLLKEILEFKPDVIYATHFYGAIALTDLKLVYPLPCVTIVTNLDYVNSPFWEAGIGVDYFVIPHEDFIEEYEREGYKREQLLTFGMPVDERSLEKIDREEAAKKMGIDPKLFTVTVMFGGGYWNGGFKIFKGLIKALKGREAQIVMINGKNEKSFKKIAKMKFPDGLMVFNVGFTHDVPIYLSASDVIINKYGGTSVTEMVNISLPMLITEKLAAQELYNLEYMKKKGVALSFKNNKTLKEQILKLMDDEALRKRMGETCDTFRRPATQTLAEFILGLPNADYSALGEISPAGVKKKVKAALKKADKSERKKK